MMRSNRISHDVLQKYLPARSDSVSKAAKDIVERRGITISSYKDVPIAEKFWLSGDQGFGIGFLLCFVLVPGGWRRAMQVIRRR